MKGSALASGAPSARFTSATGRSEFVNDLMTQTSFFVKKKYDIDDEAYNQYVNDLQNDIAVPELVPVSVVVPISSGAAQEIEQEPAPLPTPKPVSYYEGEPFGDNLLIERVEKEHSSQLVIPDSLKGKSEIGYVKSIGDKVKKVKVSELVMFDGFAAHGADVDLIDEEGTIRHYLLLKEHDLLLKLKKVIHNE